MLIEFFASSFYFFCSFFASNFTFILTSHCKNNLWELKSIMDPGVQLLELFSESCTLKFYDAYVTPSCQRSVGLSICSFQVILYLNFPSLNDRKIEWNLPSPKYGLKLITYCVSEKAADHYAINLAIYIYHNHLMKTGILHYNIADTLANKASEKKLSWYTFSGTTIIS